MYKITLFNFKYKKSNYTVRKYTKHSIYAKLVHQKFNKVDNLLWKWNELLENQKYPDNL